MGAKMGPYYMLQLIYIMVNEGADWLKGCKARTKMEKNQYIEPKLVRL